jgi:protein ImuB
MSGGSPAGSSPAASAAPTTPHRARLPRSGGARAAAPRTLAVWCPDWPVIAALRSAQQAARADPLLGGLEGLNGDGRDAAPVAVFTANRVVACSQAAREAGVSRGMRRREAQSRCPQLVALNRDETAEARLFEPVVAAVESLAPGVEVSRPGLAAVAARGPTRYFGGEDAVVAALAGEVAEHVEDALIGIADGPFAAEQAARRGIVVPPGASARFLAPMPVAVLGDPDLADLLRRLGIRSLGQFAQLPSRDVLARFGPTGAWAHRQARGEDARQIAARVPDIDFAVRIEFDPPLDRVDAIAFSARTTAEQFVATLADHGLACTCLELTLQTDNGEEAVRRWRHTGVLSPIDVLDRIRWQLEGWLHGRRGARDANGNSGARDADGNSGAREPGRKATAGITLLRLAPLDTVPTGAHQQALWGGSGEQDERAHRALARVQTLLGHGSVLTALRAGGRDPLQRTQLVPWGDERSPGLSPDEPWPGALPAPAPAVLLDPPTPAQVLDDAGRAVWVTERGGVPMPPARLSIDGGAAVAVTAWAGPWPVDEQWWQDIPDGRGAAGGISTGGGAAGGRAGGELPRRRYRFQLVDVRGRAYLAICSPGSGASAQWSIEGVYD